MLATSHNLRNTVSNDRHPSSRQANVNSQHLHLPRSPPYHPPGKKSICLPNLINTASTCEQVSGIPAVGHALYDTESPRKSLAPPRLFGLDGTLLLLPRRYDKVSANKDLHRRLYQRCPSRWRLDTSAGGCRSSASKATTDLTMT